MNLPRKILLVTNDFGPRAGGIETFILGLLEQLDGSQVVVYTSFQPGSTEFDNQLLKRMNVVVIRDKAKILLPTPRINHDVTAVLRKYGCTTVWFGAAAPLGWMAPKLRKAGADKIISLSHGHEVWWCKVPLFSAIMHHIGNSLDALTYLGSFTKSALEPVVGKKVKLIRIAPGIDVKHFIPGPKSPELLRTYGLQGKKVILSVGRLVHRKGQDRLIQAMPKILQSIPDARLLFVGTGPYKEQLVKLVEKHKLQDYVQFVGRLTYPELPTYIQLGDVFVMPSRSRFFGLEVEGLGIVYLEASACGLPVIAGNSGGAPDAVLINETGLVVDGTKISEIAEATISLLSNPVKSQAFGKRGREWIESDWDWQIWGERFKALL